MVYHAPQGQPPMPSGPPSFRPKKRSGFTTFLIVIGAIVAGFIGLLILIGILGAILFGGNDSEDTAITQTSAVASPGGQPESKDPAVQPPAENTYAIGQPVTSKKFEYVITDFQCGIPSVGEYEVTKEVAKGQFCVLAITAKNIANRAEDLDFDDFKLMSGDNEYSTDSWVNITAANGTESSGFYDEVNPGLQVTGSIYFDVPLEVAPDRAMIDDTLFGDAATVLLK